MATATSLCYLGLVHVLAIINSVSTIIEEMPCGSFNVQFTSISQGPDKEAIHYFVMPIKCHYTSYLSLNDF